MAYGPDYATGRRVNLDKPEERVRQEYERALVESYGYLKSEIDIEVRIPRGTGFFPDAADIVIYRSDSDRDPASAILGIVETKQPDRTDGIGQLKSYVTATSALWAVWTNGDDIAYLARDPASAQVREDGIYNIPERGQAVTGVGRITKADLAPFSRTELKPAFRRILRNLYANTNISRREKLGSEMIKLIFCKIEDERTYPDSAPAFRADPGEDPSEIKRRIDGLFERVLKDLEPDGVFTPAERITLDANSVAWVVGQLERGSLLLTDSDVVGDAFEVFAESRLVGEKGEFFTPRGVVNLAVQLADPAPDETVCDPACGSGGFLLAAMRYVWRKMDQDPRWRGAPGLRETKRAMAQRTVFGIDKETDLVKIAKAHMAIAGDGRSNISHDNSLHRAEEYEPATARHFVQGGDFRQFDHVMTNPPYGTKTKVLKRDSAQFELGHQWKKDTETGAVAVTGKVMERDPYILFLERSLAMLRDRGNLCVVLPESVLHAPTLQYVRQFMLDGNNLRAVISLPHNTFRPHCNAKTVLLAIQKRAPQGPVIMAIPEEMGHDLNGQPLYRAGTDEPWDDLPTVARELETPASPANQFTFEVEARSLNRDTLMPSYYLPRPKLPDGREGVTLGALVDAEIIDAFNGHGSPRNTEKGTGTIPYIRVADIVNWELYRNPVSGVSEDVYERLTRNKRTPVTGDVVLVRRGSYRIGTVAMVSPRDTQLVMTAELLSLRLVEQPNDYGLTPHYLLALLSSDHVQKQIPQLTFVDTTLPNLGDRWRELVLPIHATQEERERVSEQTRQALEAKWDAQHRIDELRASFSAIVT